MIGLISNLLSRVGAPCPNPEFFGIPAWYKYLNCEPDAVGKPTPVVDISNPAGRGFMELLPIGLAIIDMLLRIAGIVAVVFIIYAGFQYVTSMGEPDQTREAKDGIINALVGLGIVIISSAVVAFIGNALRA